MSNYGYAAACLQQGMSYQGAARAAGVNEADLRRVIPRAAVSLPPEPEEPVDAYEACASYITDADAKACRKIAALSIALLCEKVGPTMTQAVLVNIACALPSVRAITAPLPFTNEPSGERISAREVIDFVCDRFDISFGDLCSVRRPNGIARPRQMAMYAVKHLCPHMSYPAIGRMLGGRDHTTILHGVRKITAMIETDQEIATHAEQIIRHFAGRPDTLGMSPLAEAIRFRRLCDNYGEVMRLAA